MAARHASPHDGHETAHVDGAGAARLHGGIADAVEHMPEGFAENVFGKDAAGFGIAQAAAQIDDVEIQRYGTDKVAGRAHAAFAHAVREQEHLAVAFFMGKTHDVMKRRAVFGRKEGGMGIDEVQGHDVRRHPSQQGKCGRIGLDGAWRKAQRQQFGHFSGEDASSKGIHRHDLPSFQQVGDTGDVEQGRYAEFAADGRHMSGHAACFRNDGRCAAHDDHGVG